MRKMQKRRSQGTAFLLDGGGRTSPSRLCRSVALAAIRDACVAATASEPASLQVQKSRRCTKNKKADPLQGPALFILVAGARYENYVQIKIEPYLSGLSQSSTV